MKTIYRVKCIKIEEGMSLPVTRLGITAFIVCENVEDEGFIQRFADALLESNCREAYFYGKHSEKWRSIVAQTDLDSGLPYSVMEIALRNSEHFMHTLKARVDSNEGDRLICLFYDDKTIFEHAIAYLVNKKRQCPLMDWEFIEGDKCIEYGMVADRQVHPSWLPECIQEKEDFRETCRSCKYHDIDDGTEEAVDMTKPKSEILLDMMERLFNGEYSPFEFSLDFPDFCYENYDALEEECEGLGYYLDQEVPDICDEGEPKFCPDRMIAQLKRVYRAAKRKIERGGKPIPPDKVTIQVTFEELLDGESKMSEQLVEAGNAYSGNDTLVVNRLEKTVEYSRNICDKNQVYIKYRLTRYAQDWLDNIDARDLLWDIEGAECDSENQVDCRRVYEIAVEADGMERRVVRGQYCAEALPYDYGEFVGMIQSAFRRVELWGDIFNVSLYRKRFTKASGLIYCAVEFGDYGREYHYLTDDDSIEEGDLVIVPVGSSNYETEAVVVEKTYCTEETAPYPLSKVKKILRKVEIIYDVTPRTMECLVGKKIRVVDVNVESVEGIVGDFSYDEDANELDFSLQTDEGCIHIDADEVLKILIKE